ncbi:antibiotic biosynthesis monooxygenase [Conexibacter sp. S30A1]|jgi:heme-degrading monooxygenase HmoA|uniref:antibiotic biosynthesis monooxygenase family protein n=1 Tax=Conexibacter sp. S30A1 TaxID=2937800 RepID=UPI00200F3C8A|nr:antibiotic biosynthesis monooxygenase family protein [Conexibacter sp. S30A1]
MIRSVLHLRPRAGRSTDIVDFYRRYHVLERASRQEGFISSELQLPIHGEGDVLVTALWRDADAYKGWLENPDRALHTDELAELVEDFHAGVSGETYEIVLDERGER